MAIPEADKLKSFCDELRAATSGDLVGYSADERQLRSNQLRELNHAARQFIEHLNELPVDDTIDLAAMFEGVRDDVATAYERWRGSSSVHDVHAHLLNEVASLHEKINTLYWMVREQEADRDKTLPGEFANPDDLFSALHGYKNPKVFTIDVTANHSYEISLEIDGQTANCDEFQRTR
jgi:hypothetical protein